MADDSVVLAKLLEITYTALGGISSSLERTSATVAELVGVLAAFEGTPDIYERAEYARMMAVVHRQIGSHLTRVTEVQTQIRQYAPSTVSDELAGMIEAGTARLSVEDRVLDALCEHYPGELSTSEIRERAQAARRSVQRSLGALSDRGVVSWREGESNGRGRGILMWRFVPPEEG